MNRKRFGIGLCAGALVALSTSAQAHETGRPPVDIRRFAAEAELIFKGTVVDVTYRDSESVPALDENGAPGLDDEGGPALQDGSNTPHTFVTYRIERILKGSTAGSTITLRFFGGLDDEPWVGVDDAGNPETAPKVVETMNYPTFDLGDRDLLFVDGNTSDDCPLVDCAEGRFRLIPYGDGQRSAVYSDQGYETFRARARWFGVRAISEVGRGRFVPSPEVLEHTIAPGIVETTVIHASEPSEPHDVERPSRRRRATESAFTTFVKTIVRQTNSRESLAALPATPSADPTQPFFARPMTSVPPAMIPVEVVTAPPRPWLDRLPAPERAAILESERLEAEAFEANDGNPVLR